MSLHDIEIPTYEQIRDMVLKLIDEGKMSREDAALVLPELRESEDERIRKEIIDHLVREVGLYPGVDRKEHKWLRWLEKQKDILGERAKNITANMLEDGIEGIQRELIEFLSNTVNASWVDIIRSADAYAERIRNIIEKQKINTDGDFARGYNCGYEHCLNSHSAEWFEKQKDNKFVPRVLPSSTAWFEDGEEKQKENPKTVDSISADCVSDVIRADIIITRAIVALSDDVDYNRDEPCKYRREIDDLKKLRDVLCRQKEQKPALYWHKIKANDYLPCRAYLWKLAYEEENNFMGKCHVDGYLVPNEPVGVGCDTWYLPVEDIKNLPKEEELDTVSPMKTVEQKPASGNSEKPNNHAEWSEEERRLLHNAENAVYQVASAGIGGYTKKDYEEISSFFRNLRTSHPQSKQEWSEDDKKTMDDIIFAIKEVWQEKDANRMIAKLKSLRPQPHWKPSEEQMGALNYAYCELFKRGDVGHNILGPLQTLIDTLRNV